MTESEFWQALRKTRGPNWRATNDGMIRAALTRDRCDCPITAVCRAVTGKEFTPKQYLSAARELGLSARFSLAVASSADGWDDTHRQQILACVMTPNLGQEKG